MNQSLINEKKNNFTIQTLLHDCPTLMQKEISINKILKLPQVLWLKNKVIVENDAKIINNRPYYTNMDIICKPAGMAQCGFGFISLFIGLTHIIGSIVALPFLLCGLYKKKKYIRHNKKAQLYYSIIERALKICDKKQCHIIYKIESYIHKLEASKSNKKDFQNKKKELMCDNYPTEQMKIICLNEINEINKKINICDQNINYYNEKLINYPLDDDLLNNMIDEYNKI